MTLMSGLLQATVQELSELSGRTAQSLYPHLDALVAADFLIAREPSETGRRSRLYVLGPAAELAPSDTATGVGVRNAVELAALMLHDACARLRRYGSTADGVPSKLGLDAECVTTSELTWLDPDRRREVNRLVAEIQKVVQAGREARTGERTNVIVYHFPDVTLREARDHRDGQDRSQRSQR